METEIFIAIIGGIATLLSPILALLIKKHIDTKDFLSFSKLRANVILGKWQGETLQINHKNVEKRIKIIATLHKVRRKTILGEAQLVWENKSLDIKFKGGFVSDDYVMLEYRSKNSSIVNFGNMLLKLNSNSTEFSGKIIGFGNESEGIIYGNTFLTKI